MADEALRHNGQIMVEVGGWPDEPTTASTTPIKVHQFPEGVYPARARVGVGLTLNIGNYQSVRADVSVEIPCYTEQIQEATDHCRSMAIEHMKKVSKEIRDRMEGQGQSKEAAAIPKL